MSYLSLHIVPRKPKSDQQWEEHAARQKLIRLRSLQEDADSFISKYESEVREPTSFWVNRLKDPTAWTILMVRSSEELPEDGEALLRENVEWVAFCVMIDARQVTENMVEGDWHMAAVWLSPELRGQGTGRRLVQYGLDLAKAQNDRDGFKGGHCSIGVVHGNDNALELYKKMGFNVTNANGTTEKEGRIYDTTNLELAL